ncbi:chloride channel protein 2-like [Episyrphus balteatus]|uniref:chloride channel protein 2-like n=1 Tax=Episyrphus balteatus TaxID=286459 RepID=UPI0024860E17|nr:chloride channel protein 2-like [Episyrphus balteatus]
MEKDPLHNDSSPKIVAKPKKIDRSGSVEVADTLTYTHTLMYGKYAEDLSDYAKDESKRLKLYEKRQRAEDKRFERERLKYNRSLMCRGFYWLLDHTLSRFGEEWIFLALLGIIMAFISFGVDLGVNICTNGRMFLYRDIFNSSILLQFVAWIVPSICLVLFACGFTHLVAPQAVGSGIPEMKTILRGVVLKEYLTFKTLLVKVIGLTAALGAGIPIGKEGPFVHIASIVATLLSKLRFHRIYENKSRYTEMLSVACAVGIGACFAAPIGGVLFSIEATTTYFAVRNCWRGFFSAFCGSSVFLLMAVWFQNADTVKPLFLTNFTSEFPFAPQELFVYSLMGVICGFLGAGYVWLHRWYVTYIRTNKTINNFLQKNRFLYPTIIAFIVATISFPLGTGQFFGSELSTHEQLTELFSNFTWSGDDPTVGQANIISHWKTPGGSIFLNLTCYVLFTYIFSIICYTLPLPSGSFIPVFKIGAGFGRLFGELMHIIFPQGVWYGGILSSIIPGGYAVVGAAAFSSAVTHTVSEAVIIFEITGQVTHVVPVMVASLIANAVAEMLQPSMYDSMILIKKLPYLPDLLPTSSRMYSTMVDDFMQRDVKFIWPEMTYQELKDLLVKNRHIRGWPLVDTPENMILLGSIQKAELLGMVQRQICKEKRQNIAHDRYKMAEEQALEKEKLEYEEKLLHERRRSSRFEVTPALDILDLESAKKSTEELSDSTTLETPKSILKKSTSFTLSPSNEYKSDNERRLQDIFNKSHFLQDIEKGLHKSSTSSGSLKKVHVSHDTLMDMSPEDRKLWECEEMAKVINFEEHNVCIDPSPFQLVERTNISKVHTLFNMVGINHAYVTKIGRLVGVVGLTELRKAIEDINSNSFAMQSDSDEKCVESKPLLIIEKNGKNPTVMVIPSELGSDSETDSKTALSPY